MKDEMAFFFNHSEEHQASRSLQTEPISIGGEAWIDVSRFFPGEKLEHQAVKDVKAPVDHPRSDLATSPLTKSFALLRRKFRRGSTES